MSEKGTEVAEETKEAPAANVVEALARVMRDLPGIGKDERAAEGQGGYAYRGIEAITRHAQVLLAREGIVPVPRVVAWERDEVAVGNNKVWHDERIQVVYRFTRGGDDYVDVGPIPAVGRDGTDKGTNKAMTQAFKYALIQVLCISDRADDADGQPSEEGQAAPEAQRRSSQRQGRDDAAELRDLVTERVEHLPDALRTPFVAWKNDQGFTWPWNTAMCNAMLRHLDELEAAADARAKPEPDTEPDPEPEPLVTPAERAADEAAALADAQDLASTPCSICGSDRTERVLVGDVVRCARANDCKKRAAKKAEKAAAEQGLVVCAGCLEPIPADVEPHVEGEGTDARRYHPDCAPM